MNFYEEKLKELDLLVTNKQYEEALRLINLELSMPYIPKDFETELLAIKAKLPLDETKINNKVLPPEEVFTLLAASQLDPIEKIGLIQSLQAVNLRNYVDEVQVLLGSSLENEIKMILCYFLCQQQIDHSFVYQKTNQSLSINPATFDLASQEIVPMAVIEKLTTILNAISPQLLEMAKQITINFYAKLFPITEEINLDLLAKAIIKVVYRLNNLSGDLPYNHSASEEQAINDYVDWIKELNAV